MKLNNVRLLVSKFDECFLFYRDMLGFTVTWGGIGENYAHFQAGETGELSIFSQSIMANVVNTTTLPPRLPTQDNMAIIFSVADVDQIYHSLHAKGVVFVNKPVDQPDWGVRVAHVRDPEGNLLEFIMDLPKK